MIKNIMNNIGTKDVNKALEKYKTDAKNMTTEQLGYYVEDLKNGTGNIGKENLEERIKIYGDELEARNGKKEEVKEDVEKPEDDILSGFSLTSEEHRMYGLKDNSKKFPFLQPLVKQREPFFQKKIEAWEKLKENPNNPKARADYVDASNAISQLDSDIDKLWKKETEFIPGV